MSWREGGQRSDASDGGSARAGNISRMEEGGRKRRWDRCPPSLSTTATS